MRYWRAVIRYGHVGSGKHIAVTRHLIASDEYDIFDIIDIIKGMPAVKKSRHVIPILELREISYDEYIDGKATETDNNLYLKRLLYGGDMSNNEESP